MAKTIAEIQTLIDGKTLDARQLINLIVDYLQDNPGGANDVRIYRALLSQGGTNAPTVLELENSTGETPVWSYGSTGYYICTFAQEIGTLYNAWFSISPSTQPPKRTTIANNDGFSFYVATYNDTTLANGVLLFTSIEVIFYTQ